MERYFKPARHSNLNRGFFSYITESVYNIGNAYKNNLNNEIKVFFDLINVPGYITGNMFDVCFIQDYEDYLNNNYSNIEEINNSFFNINPYSSDLWSIYDREYSEKIIKKHFILNDEIKNEMSTRVSENNLNETIGVHRRATDIYMHHQIVPIERIYSEIESEDFNTILLLSDNINDLNSFKSRYGNRLITYDEGSTSMNNEPFHKSGVVDEKTKINHIKEIVMGSLMLGMTKKLICSQSNLTNFSILSNSKLNYKILS